jgi:hypothetical protein
LQIGNADTTNDIGQVGPDGAILIGEAMASGAGDRGETAATLLIVSTTIVTIDGRVVAGRIGNNNIIIVEDMLNAGRLTGINRDDVESVQPSPISMMPEGLLNTP